MTDRPPFSFLDILLLGLVLLLACGARAAYLNACESQGAAGGLFEVQGSSLPIALPERPTELDSLVANLQKDHWFGTLAPLAMEEEATAHTAPGYPWLLALVHDLPVDADRTVCWAQVGLGSLTAVFYFLFALRAFSSRLVGFVVGLLCALSPFWIANVAEINDGVLASFLLAAALFLGARGAQTGGASTSLLYGLTLAGLALVRASFLPFAFVAILWFLLRCRQLPRGWLYALLAFLGFTNGLVPWTLRNYQVMRDVVPVVDSAYWHLWMGNNPLATGGPQTEAQALKALAETRESSPEEVLENLRDVGQVERYRRLAPEVVKVVSGDPGGTLERRLWASCCFVFGEKWLTERALAVENAAAAKWKPTGRGLLAGSFLGMLLLALLGWRWTFPWRRESALATLALIWGSVPYLLSHAEALHGPRLPLDGVLLCYAGFALVALLPRGGKALRQGPSVEEEGATGV